MIVSCVIFSTGKPFKLVLPCAESARTAKTLWLPPVLFMTGGHDLPGPPHVVRSCLIFAVLRSSFQFEHNFREDFVQLVSRVEHLKEI